MARGTQLSALVDQLRAEIGASTNVAMGVNTLPNLKQILRRTQERLWSDFDWPFAFIERDEPLLANQRYYAFDNDIDFDRINEAWVRYSETWRPLNYGITQEHYNRSDPATYREDPCTNWRHYEGNQFEVWPVPASAQTTLRFKAIKKLPPLIDDTDRAELDDALIVLFAAAELLSRAKAEDAQAKMQMAMSHYAKLKGNTSKNRVFVLGGDINIPKRTMQGGRI